MKTPVQQRFFRTRAEKILSLLPKPYADSDGESEEEEELLGAPEIPQLPEVEVPLFTDELDEEVEELFQFLETVDIKPEEDLPEIMDCKQNAVQPLLPAVTKQSQTPPVLRRRHTGNIEIKKNKKKLTQKIKKIKRVWNRTQKIDFEVGLTSSSSFIITNLEDDVQEEEQPGDYFRRFFDSELINLIVEQSNLYSLQKEGKCSNLTRKEILNFIGVQIHMGIVKMPSYEDYFANLTRYPKVADVMSSKVYKRIRRYIHFNDNSQNDGDRWYKIRPVMEYIRKKFVSIGGEKTFSIDEMMIPYKGFKAGALKQYVKSKPKKWGFKFFVRSGISGIIHDFLPYSGEQTFANINFNHKESKFTMSAKVIIALCKSIQDKPLSFVYFDNFFTNLNLLSHLRQEHGILALGTIRKDRIEHCPIENDKSLNKRGRGSFDQIVDEEKNVVLVKWLDRKSVLLASNFCGSEPIQKIERYFRELKKKVQIDCPNIVKLYNAFMGGVDLSDMIIALYRIHIKSKKWYFNVFGQLIDMAINNAWLLWKKNTKKKMCLKKFRIDVAESLFREGSSKKGRPSNSPRPINNLRHVVENQVPSDELRFSGAEHLPIFETKGRCRLCRTGQTIFKCKCCQIRLCLVPKRNCFENFHIPPTN